MRELVYVLCALTSASCALLLARGYAHSHVRLLFWSALCFAGLTLNNVILFIDVVVVPDTDLALLRGLTAFLALSTLVFGLVWEGVGE